MRTLSYAQAISEGTVQAMDRDPSVFIAGIAVDYPSGIFGTTTEPFKRLRVAGDVLRKELQRNETAELVVLGFVDDAHASATEFLDHSIVGNSKADRRLRFCHGWRTS